MDQTQHTTAKDFFLNLGAIVSFYVLIISLVNLVFSIINYSFPDALNYYYVYQNYSSTARWTISSIVVVFPLYVFLAKYIAKDHIANPFKKDYWIKKWSKYLTLFLTGAAIVIDVVVLINTFLGGEISTRFALKALAVLIIAGFVFFYFYDEARKYNKIITIVSSIVILLAIIAGFMTVGSPSKQRAMRFDETRVQDLQSIQWKIIEYWQRKDVLPSQFSDLDDSISGFTVPTDPKNNSSYEYSVKGKNTFELCATFETDRPSDQGISYDYSYPYPVERNSWKHDIGRTCFERTIDPELYPKLTPGGVPVEKEILK